MAAEQRTHEGLTRILAVEDDIGLIGGLKSALENEGCAVRAVNQGNKAVDAAERFKPDIVLLDVMMPGVDGWEVLARLRDNASTRHVPVIMLTAADSDAAKIKGFTLGADDYVTKPFSIQELRCRIAAVLRRTQRGADEPDPCSIPVIAPGSDSDLELLRCSEVFFIDGIRNFSYIHTFDDRRLCRLTLGALDQRKMEGFMRVHRSFIVNLNHVKTCGWASRSAYRLTLADAEETDIPVSRPLVVEVQRRLGLKA